ncbi:MAG TPA: hypothetical protein PLA25_13225, partial [Anaerolineaceae bacterium]|nr:hypothetical protein [Anaerolineaceae bacterium]
EPLRELRFTLLAETKVSSISDSARGCTAWVAMIVVLILLIAFALSIIALAASIILWLRSAWAIIKDAFTPAMDSSINTL